MYYCINKNPLTGNTGITICKFHYYSKGPGGWGKCCYWMTLRSLENVIANIQQMKVSELLWQIAEEEIEDTESRHTEVAILCNQ